MANYDEVKEQALKLQQAMMANPEFAHKDPEEIASDAIFAAEDILKVLEGRKQLAELLEASQQVIDQRQGAGRGVISWLFGDPGLPPDHLG
jgi:hypothetical protein